MIHHHSRLPFHTNSSSLAYIRTPRLTLGVSLLEILISLTLGLMLLAMVLQAYLGTKSVISATVQNTKTQNNIRFLSYFLHRQISMSGYAGCGKLSDLNLKNNTSFDFLDTNIIYGFSSDHLPVHSKLKKYQIAPNTDIIVIQKANEGIAAITDEIKAGAENFHATENPATQNNHTLLLADCVNGDLFDAINIGGKLVRAHHKIAHQYSVSATTVSRFTQIAYFISTTTSGDKRQIGLYYAVNYGNKEMLADGVNSMKIRYGVVDHRDKPLANYYSAEQVTAGNLWNKVTSVMITLTQSTITAVTKTLSWNIYIKLRER